MHGHPIQSTPIVPPEPENESDNESDNDATDDITPALPSSPPVPPPVAVYSPPKPATPIITTPTIVPAQSTIRQTVPPRSPSPPAPAPAPPRVAYQPTPHIAPPRTLIAQMQHKSYRPHQLPFYDFIDSSTAFAHLTNKDYYTTATHYREKCERLHRSCPKAAPPSIADADTPSMAKYKYDMYYKQVAALKSALQVGNLIYLAIMGVEWFLKNNKWFKVKAHGLYQLQYANREDYYDAMLSMGEQTLGWFKGNVSGVWRMLLMFVISTVMLIGTNYLIEYVVPQPMRAMAHQAKDVGVKYFQDMSALFLGLKSVDPEKADDGWANNLFAMASNLMTGQAVKPPSETHLHEE